MMHQFILSDKLNDLFILHTIGPMMILDTEFITKEEI
jgi:hypothetical protein